MAKKQKSDADERASAATADTVGEKSPTGPQALGPHALTRIMPQASFIVPTRGVMVQMHYAREALVDADQLAYMDAAGHPYTKV